MRFGSPQLLNVLTGSFDFWWVCDVFYNGSRILADVPVTNVTFNDDDFRLGLNAAQTTLGAVAELAGAKMASLTSKSGN